MTLTLVYKGKDKGLKSLSRKTIDAVYSKYGEALKDWDGNLDSMRGIRDLLSDSIFK